VNNEIHSKELTGTSLTFDQLLRAVELVRVNDVSHPDVCSRRCIPSYARRKRWDMLTVQMLSLI